MKNLHNIEKSAFHKGEYVGYSGGYIFRIHKTNSSYGNWFAYNPDGSIKIYAWRLEDMSKKLSEIDKNKLENKLKNILTP